MSVLESSVFFFNDTATTEIYTLSLHDALPISDADDRAVIAENDRAGARRPLIQRKDEAGHISGGYGVDRKSTRLNSSHANISYAVFCLKKKKSHTDELQSVPHTHLLHSVTP